ncbi:hypothetical protein LOK49_LG08G00095 [Camellia lanceoleosa]|uniref:Uncharacterized protein n=1 Tax=Camellia lanceoleosa TaxID=1840588 RepID=A0ACC0GRL8_9ERIC|nr:hypothetical protein LOK49_LG08G00095 [Camellia lanceoleosa]
MHRIVDNGPYAIQGALLIVDYWKPELVFDRLIFDKMLVWVQLYGLPLECFTEEAGVSLGRAVGDVVKVDIDSFMPRNIRFLRLRVWVSLVNLLISGFFLKFSCALSFDEAQRQLDDNLREMGRRLHSPVMTQASYPMYSAAIRANAHRSERRTTRIFQHPTHSHMEIPEEVALPTHGHDTNPDADFVDMWERDWDTGLQQGTPAGSDSSLPIVRRDGVISPSLSPENRLVASDVLSGLGQAPVDSVGELEVMWHQWEGQLSSMGIRPGQLVTERVGELTAPPRQDQQIYSGSLHGSDQGPLPTSTEDVIRAIQLHGTSPRLNFPLGEAPITTRAFVRDSPSHWPPMGSVTFEVGQSSSMTANGLPFYSVKAAIPHSLPTVSLFSRPSIRKRLRETDTGFDLLYDTEPIFGLDQNKSFSHACTTELLMHASGVVSDSVCPPHSLGSLVRKHVRHRKKARHSLNSGMHAHVLAVTWPPRDALTRASFQRRCRKQRLRTHHRFAITDSLLGSSLRRRRGQSSRFFDDHQRGVSQATGLLGQTAFTSESGYDTGLSSPEGRGLCYEASQEWSPSNLAQINRLGSSLGFKNYSGVDCNGKAGGLWVGWTDDLLIDVCEQNVNFIILQVHDMMKGCWFIIFMYGSPCTLAWGQVWSSVEAKFQHFHKPFIIMEDLNQVRGWAEKLSSQRRVIPGASAFNDLIFRNRLVDLPSQGVWYTWCNNRKETEVVYERLDRGSQPTKNQVNVVIGFIDTGSIVLY